MQLNPHLPHPWRWCQCTDGSVAQTPCLAWGGLAALGPSFLPPSISHSLSTSAFQLILSTLEPPL